MLVIKNNKPVQMNTHEIIAFNTEQLKKILEKELKLSLSKINEEWHLKRLETYFITYRLYRNIEDSNSYEEATKTTFNSLSHLNPKLKREITFQDIEKLLNIPIKRITKFDLQQNEKELVL